MFHIYCDVVVHTHTYTRVPIKSLDLVRVRESKAIIDNVNGDLFCLNFLYTLASRWLMNLSTNHCYILHHLLDVMRVINVASY